MDGSHRDLMDHCLRIMPEWTDDIEITPITTGLTNQNYRAQCRGKSVFLRVFGPADFNVDRENELAWRTFAAERGLSPRILGAFQNGWIEEFVAGRTWRVNDLQENTEALAELVKKLHALWLPGPPVLYDRLAAWHRLASSHPLCPPVREIEGLTAYLESVNSPIVFCHNDLQEGNLMQTDTVVAVDFEFAGLNPRGFDLANLFCEMAIDNQVAEFPGFAMDFSKYPSRASRDAFYRVYSDDPNLEREVDAFVLASHLQWALWGIVQAYASEIKFGFIEYAEQRLAEYYKKKGEMQLVF